MFGIDDAIALPVLGNLASGLLGNNAQSEANKANERIAVDNRAFQERMSSTAYQRSMADMKKAGLNPILAANNGGASTPSGATGTMEPVDAAAKSIGTIANSALDTANMKKQLAKVDSEVKFNNELMKTERTKQIVNAHSARQIDLDNIITGYNLPQHQSTAELKRKLADWDKSGAGFYSNLFIGKLGQIANSASNLASTYGSIAIPAAIRSNKFKMPEKFRP